MLCYISNYVTKHNDDRRLGGAFFIARPRSGPHVHVHVGYRCLFHNKKGCQSRKVRSLTEERVVQPPVTVAASKIMRRPSAPSRPAGPPPPVRAVADPALCNGAGLGGAVIAHKHELSNAVIPVVRSSFMRCGRRRRRRFALYARYPSIPPPNRCDQRPGGLICERSSARTPFQRKAHVELCSHPKPP